MIKNRKKLKKIFLYLIICILTFSSLDARSIASRTFRFTYSFTIRDIPEDAKEIKYWIPLPIQGEYQQILKTNIKAPGKYEITEDNKYNNRFLYAVCKNEGTSSLTGRVTYDVIRRERLDKPMNSPSSDGIFYPRDLIKYLQPGVFATISPRVRELARVITKDKSDPFCRARALYDYVFENMEYNKVEPGWGYGDTERACDIRKGNCTDFHSLFISLSRASGIPAKFVIGFNIPEKSQSVIEGYHCWAEFYLKGPEWVPVDISRAWKERSKKEYYFGNLDENRIEFTAGRDIVLTPAQKGGPLNYFIYPYTEIDGKEAYNIETSIESK